MEVKAKVQLTTKEMYEFLMRHTYSSMSGFIGLILSIGGFVGFFYMLGMPDASLLYLGALLLTGLLFTVVQPLMVLKNAKKQAKFYEKESLEYIISKKGIDVRQGDKTGFSSWDDITKITSSKNIIVMYTTRVHAYVIPRTAIGDQADTLKTIVRECSNAKYIKL